MKIFRMQFYEFTLLILISEINLLLFLFHILKHHSRKCHSTWIKSSLPELIYKKSVVKHFSKFTGKHLCWTRLLSCERLRHRCLKLNSYFEGHLRTAASSDYWRVIRKVYIREVLPLYPPVQSFIQSA